MFNESETLPQLRFDIAEVSSIFANQSRNAVPAYSRRSDINPQRRPAHLRCGR